MEAAFVAGFGLGFIVAAQVGPIWLLCVRTVLRGRAAAGLAIGLGAAVVDVCYAAAGAAGAGALLRISALRLTLGLIGAAVLVVLGVRTLWSAFRIRAGLETKEETMSVGRALKTSLIATASNPLTIASWGAIFAAASTARVTESAPGTVTLLLGVVTGSMTMFAALVLVMATLKRHVGARGLRAVDVLSGAGLVGFGGLLGWKSLQHG
jgi:threonine/homoserine/homoserine lactone efflux protein